MFVALICRKATPKFTCQIEEMTGAVALPLCFISASENSSLWITHQKQVMVGATAVPRLMFCDLAKSASEAAVCSRIVEAHVK